MTYQYCKLWQWRSPVYVLALLCQCLSSYSHTSTFGKLKKVFFQLHSDTSLKLAFLANTYNAPFPSQSKKTLQYCQYLLCLWTVLAFHKFHGLFGNFPVGLISWICMHAWIHYQQKHNQLKKTASLCSTRQGLRCQHKKKPSCLNRWQYQV